jgi:hypothetical protein
MDFAPIITIIISLIVVYFFIKLIVSPLIKVIIGIAVFLIMIYLLQHFLNFDVSKSFGPFGKYLDLKNWGINLQDIMNQIGNYIKKTLSF